MKVYLKDIDRAINANNIQEITNPVILQQGFIPSDDGLLSTRIFGTSTKDRRSKYGYIDLHGNFLHPLVYKNLTRMDARIESIVAGTKTFSIDKNGFIYEDEKGGTGLGWLYKNWSKIKFKTTKSTVRDRRIKFINLNSQKKLFPNKFLVQPAFFRDINLSAIGAGKPSIHEINRPYTKLIRLASTLKQGGEFNFVLNNTKYQIQLTLVEIYDYFKSKISGKRGLMRQNILGKSIDYGSRLVISAPHYNQEYYKDSPVDFYHTGLPLSSCCSNAFPFIVGWLQNFFMQVFELEGKHFPIFVDNKKEPIYTELDNPAVKFSEEYIEKLVTRYIYSYGERFDFIELPVKDKSIKHPAYLMFKGRRLDKKDEKIIAKYNNIGRPMTITDLLYLACYDVLKDKHVYITRYPITDFMGIFPTRIHVMSTNNTCVMKYNDEIYKFYPDIDLTKSKDDVSRYFIDVLQMQNGYLSAIGGDYDGDTVSTRIVFSQEANIEAERILTSKINLLDITGRIKRTTEKEAILSLYEITKD